MNRDPRPNQHPERISPRADDRKESEPDEREGATERDVGDRTGPGAGYDNEPEQETDRGGVSES